MAKTKSITLEAGDRQQDFEISHAERILRMPNNGGWKLTDKSNYEFDQKNGLTRKTSSRKAKKSDQKESDS